MLHEVEAEKTMLDPVKKVIRSFHSTITEGKSLVALNADFLERHKNSLDHLIPGEGRGQGPDIFVHGGQREYVARAVANEVVPVMFRFLSAWLPLCVS